MVQPVPSVLTEPRRRGPAPYFTGKRLEALAEYLVQEGATIESAAKHFRCATSTIEKTLKRLRREARVKAAAPSPGDGSSDTDGQPDSGKGQEPRHQSDSTPLDGEA